MPQQHRYEGPTLALLLERVTDELGPNARIVEANRLRRGGVGGFFSRETYEVIAESDGTPATAVAPAASATAPAPAPAVADERIDVTSAARSILELADEVNAHERAVEPEVHATEPEPPAPPAPPAPAPITPNAPVAATALAPRPAPAAAPTTLLAPKPAPRMAEAVTRSQPAPVAPASMLDDLDVDADLDTDTDVDHDDEPFVPFTPAATIATIATRPEPKKEPAADEGPQISTESTSFAEILDRIAYDVDAGSEIVIQPTPAMTAVPPTVTTPTAATPTAATPTVAPPTVTTPKVTAPTVAARQVTTRPAASVNTARPAPAPVPPMPARVAATPVRRLGDEPNKDLEPFTNLGLPVHLAPLVVGDRDLRVVLADRLRTLPTAPPFPTARGSLMVVVGDARSSLRVARDVAEELEVSVDDIAYATQYMTDEVPAWLHIGSASDAIDRRRSWRRREELTLVAIDSPVGRLGSTWARDVIDALEPSLVWGVVDAARKPEDVLAWTDHLGGLDSFAVEALEETVSPAAILRLPIPVARLDGVQATPDRWASILAARIAA